MRVFYLCGVLAFLAACDTSSNINPPNRNYFIKYFGGDGNQAAVDLIANTDGTFYILGNSRTTPDSIQRVYLARVNAFGEVSRQILYGTVDMDAKDIELSLDKTMIVAVANKGNASSNADILLRRFTLNLDPVDSAVVFAGATNTGSEYANSVTELTTGGFIVEGYQPSGPGQFNEIHLRVDGQLKKLGPGWKETGGVGSMSVGTRAIEHQPGVYYVFGYNNAPYTGSSNNEKFWVFSIGDNGDFLNNGDLSAFEKPGSSFDRVLTYASKAGIGGFLLPGISSSLQTDSLKIAITFSNKSSLDFNKSDVFKDVLLTDLGKGPKPFATAYSGTLSNFILANIYNSASTPTSDIMLIKVNNALQPQWGGTTIANYVQFGGDGDDTAAAVAELPDGRIIVLGTMQLGNRPQQTKIVLMKLNSNGGLGD
jgi:hypothetical protein